MQFIEITYHKATPDSMSHEAENFIPCHGNYVEQDGQDATEYKDDAACHRLSVLV